MSTPLAPPPPAFPPDHTPPSGRRGLLCHLVWEAVLLVAVVVAFVAVVVVGDVAVRFLWAQVASVGLLAVGLSLSLRTGRPNLMVTSAGLLSGYLFTSLVNGGTAEVVAALLALAATAVLGVVVALLDAVLDAPAWALTLGTGVLVQGLILARAGLETPIRNEQGIPSGQGLYVLATLAFLAVSVAGGAVLALSPALRERLTDGVLDHRGQPSIGQRLVGSLAGIAGSTVLYGAGGVLLARVTGTVTLGGDRVAFVLAIVLLAGVSPWGRHAGIAGTALATLLLVLVSLGVATHAGPFWVSGLAVPGGAIVVGLAVVRVLDLAAGPTRGAAVSGPPVG